MCNSRVFAILDIETYEMLCSGPDRPLIFSQRGDALTYLFALGLENAARVASVDLDKVKLRFRVQPDWNPRPSDLLNLGAL